MLSGFLPFRRGFRGLKALGRIMRQFCGLRIRKRIIEEKLLTTESEEEKSAIAEKDI